jgi:hypothetical protein
VSALLESLLCSARRQACEINDARMSEAERARVENDRIAAKLERRQPSELDKATWLRDSFRE